MRLSILAFAVGVWLLQQQAALPGVGWLAGLSSGALLLLASGRFLQSSFTPVPGKSALALRRIVVPVLLVCGAAALGFVWAAAFAQLRLSEELPTALEGRDIELSGVVAGLPQALERGVRFEFDVEQVVTGVPPHISLAWYRGRDDADDETSPQIPVRAGERWRFTVRLKRPHGNLNPHGFVAEIPPTRRSNG